MFTTTNCRCSPRPSALCRMYSLCSGHPLHSEWRWPKQNLESRINWSVSVSMIHSKKQRRLPPSRVGPSSLSYPPLVASPTKLEFDLSNNPYTSNSCLSANALRAPTHTFIDTQVYALSWEQRAIVDSLPLKQKGTDAYEFLWCSQSIGTSRAGEWCRIESLLLLSLSPHLSQRSPSRRSPSLPSPSWQIVCVW